MVILQSAFSIFQSEFPASLANIHKVGTPSFIQQEDDDDESSGTDHDQAGDDYDDDDEGQVRYREKKVGEGGIY